MLSGSERNLLVCWTAKLSSLFRNLKKIRSKLAVKFLPSAMLRILVSKDSGLVRS